MKVTARVTQTSSHGGYRDQNPGSDLVPDTGMHASVRSNSKTYHGSERKIGQGK